MIVEASLDQHTRDLVSILWPLPGQRTHHFRHLLSPEVQLHSLCVPRIVDLYIHVLTGGGGGGGGGGGW